MKTTIRTLAIALTLGVLGLFASAASASEWRYGGAGMVATYPLSYLPPTHQYPPSYPPAYPPTQWGGSQWSSSQLGGKQSFTPSQFSTPRKGKKGRFTPSVPYGY